MTCGIGFITACKPVACHADPVYNSLAGTVHVTVSQGWGGALRSSSQGCLHMHRTFIPLIDGTVAASDLIMNSLAYTDDSPTVPG